MIYFLGHQLMVDGATGQNAPTPAAVNPAKGPGLVTVRSRRTEALVVSAKPPTGCHVMISTVQVMITMGIQ